MIGQKNKRNSLRRSSRRAVQAMLTYPEVIVRSVEMTSVSRRDVSSSISNNTYNRYLLEKQQKIELVWFQKTGKKSTLTVRATSPTPAVFNVTKGLSDKQWQSIQGEMPGNMTREDFNETCNTILSWVKEAIGTAVKPALDLTWEIITTNGSSILSTPSSCSRTEECSVVICPSPSSQKSLHSIPGWVMSRLKGTKTNVETVSATALITTAMVQEVMGSVPLTRDLSMDASVCLSKGPSNITLPLEDIQCYEELVTEMAKKPLATEADHPETGLKTVNWRKRVPHFKERQPKGKAQGKTQGKAQGKTTKNRRERFYFPSCCPQKAQKKSKVSSASTLSDKAKFVDDVYQDLLQEKGSAIKLCQSVEQLDLAVEECSAERFPNFLGLSQKKPETMSHVSLTKSLASEKKNSQEDVEEFQATSSQCTVARTSAPVELISNGSVHSVMNALLLKVEENLVESVLELHQAAGEFSAEVPRAIDLSVVPAISTDKMPEPSLTITKAQGKTTKNRRERFYLPSCCPQKAQKKSKVGSVSTLSDNAMFVDDVYRDLLHEKGSAIKLCQSVEQLDLAVEECSAERFPNFLGLSQKKPETMSCVSLTKSLASEKKNSQEDVEEFQATTSQCTVARTSAPVELISNGSVHSVMNALLLKVEENLVESVLELHQIAGEFSAEVPRAIDLSVVPAISTDKMPEPSLTITKAQGKTTKNRRERFYFPSCCPQKAQKKSKVGSVSTLSDNAMFVDDVYRDLLQEKGSAIKLCQSVEQLDLAVEECSAERFPNFLGLSQKKPETMSCVSLTKSLASEKKNSQEDVEEFQATTSQCTVARTSAPVELISNGSVHSVMNALLLKVEENLVESVLELHQIAGEFSAEVPRAIDLSVVPAISTDKMPEPSLTITKAQGKTTKNRRERFYFPSCCPQKAQKKSKVGSVSTLSDNAMFVDDVYRDLLQEKGSAIKLCQSVEQLDLAVEECSAERFPNFLGLSQKKPETMSCVSLTKSLASEKKNSQEDVEEFQATTSQCTVARTSAPVELISNGSVHSVMNALLLKVEENLVESVLELHQAAGEFSAEVPRAIDLSVVPAISTDKMPEPSLTITKAQGKTTKNRRERFYFPSCCPQKAQKKSKVSSASTLSDKAKFVDDVYQDLLQEKGSAIKLCQSVEQLDLAVEECSAERFPNFLGLSQKKPETMSHVSLTKSLASEKKNSQEDVEEFQATSSQCTVARTSAPVELISNGSVHSVMNALLLKVEENLVESVLELHQAAGEFSAEVPRAIDLSVVPAISTDKMPEPSLTITKAQGKTTKNRRERFYLPSCCPQKAQKKSKVGSVSTLSDNAMFVDDVYRDLLHEKGSAIKLCQSVEQLDLAVEECSAERFPNFLGLSQKKPETMSCVSLTKSLASEKKNSQEDVEEFQATTSQCTVARTSAPVELISNGSVHSVMNALLLKVEENLVESVLELHQIAGEFSAEVPRAIDLSVVPAISTDKMPEPSLTITKAQGKTTKNRRERFYFPSCCPQKAQKKSKVGSVSTLSDNAMFVDDVYRDLLQEKGSAIKLCQSVEQLDLAVEECSAERFPNFLGLSQKKPETMSCVSLTKSLASEKKNSQEDVEEFQATTSQCTVARTSAPVELISNGSVHSVMNALLLKVEENLVESVLELHQIAGEFSAEVPRAIDLSVVPAISTDKMPEPSLTITKAQGKTTKNRRERFYFPSCCPQKAQKKSKVGSVSTLSDNAMFVDDVYRDLLQEKGSAIKLCQSVEQLDLAVEECSAERFPNFLGLSQKKPETMSHVSLTKSLASEKKNSQEDVEEFQATSSQCTVARTSAPVELISNGSVHSVMNALLLKVEENLVESVLELHQAAGEFSAEVPRAIDLSVVPAISTDKMPEPSLTITKAQGKTTKNRRERFYLPSCCPQKAQKKSKVGSVSTLSDNAMFVDDVYRDLLHEKGSAIKLCQSVEQLDLAVEECSAERFPNFLGLSQKKPETMSCVSLTKSLASEKKNSQEDVEEFQATTSQCTVARTSAPVELISNGSVHSVMNALLLKVEENLVESVLELHQIAGEFSAEVPRAIDLSVVPAISTDKMPEPSLTITKAQGKTTKNRRERFYFPSCCPQKAQKKSKVGSVSTLSDNAMFVDDVYRDLLQEKGSAIKLCQSVEQLDLAVEECSAERFPNFLGLSQKKPETMSCVSLTKSLASEKKNSQEDVEEFQATTSQCTVARTSAPVELISNGSVHSVMNALLLKVEENLVESVLELHQIAGEFSAEVPRAIDLSVVPAISTDKMPEPSLTITKAQGKTTKNRRERFYFPSCCPQKAQKKSKVGSVSTLSDNAMFVDDVYRDLLQEKGSAIKLCQSVEQLDLAVEECSAERFPNFLGLSQKKPETMSCVSLTKSLASEKKNSQEDVEEFQATTSQCTVARTSAPVELISNGSVHSVMNALLLKVEENLVESVLELHQAAGEFSAEVPRAIDLSVVPAISTDKMPEPSLTITKAQGKTTKNRRERFYFPSCCPQKAQKKSKVSSASTLSDKAKFVDDVYQDLLQEKGSAIKLCQSVEQLDLAVEECSAERFPNFLGLSQKKPETMSHVSLTKSLASEKKNSQEDVEEFQATSSQCTVARTSAPVELISNGSVHSVMNALLLKVEENLVESVLELHQAAGEFSAEVPRAIDLSVVPAISTDKMPEPSLTITKAQGKTTKNRRERFYLPSCCPQKAQKKSKVGSVSTLSDNAMFVDDVYRDLLHEKGSAIKLCQSVEQLDLAVEECSAERFPNFLGLSQKKPETMSCVSLTKSLASEKKNSQEDVEEFQATTSQCTVARTSAPVELISNGSVHSVMNALLLKVEENLVESVLELHQIAGEFSAEVPRAIDLSVVPAISTDKMPEPSLTITKAQGKTTKNRRERFYFPSCCPQKAQKKSKVGSVSTLSDNAMFVDDVYRDLLQEKGSAIKLCQSVEQLDLAVEECSAERFPNFLGLSQKKPETMSCVSLTKSLASEKKNSQEDVEEFQATTSQCTVARTSAPVELISNGSVHSVMNALLLKVEENLVESVLELHQIAGEFSAEVPRAIDLSVVPAISTDKMPEPSLTITKAQGKTTKNRRERFYFPSCCPQKAQKKSKVGSVSTLSDNAMFVDDVYRDLLQEKGSAIKLCQSVEQLDLAVEECSAERFPNFLGLSQKKPETMSCVSLTKSLASEKKNSQEDVEEFQATTSQCTVARTSAPVELISNGSVHSVMNALLLKVEENLVESVLELHQVAGEFSAEVPRAIDLSVVPAISTDKMPEPSLTITKAQGKTTKNRRERFYFPSCCPQKAQKKSKVSSDDLYQDLLQKKGCAIKLCQSDEQLHLAVDECSTEFPKAIASSVVRVISVEKLAETSLNTIAQGKQTNNRRERSYFPSFCLQKKKKQNKAEQSFTSTLPNKANSSGPQEVLHQVCGSTTPSLCNATETQSTATGTPSTPVVSFSSGSVHSLVCALLLKIRKNAEGSPPQSELELIEKALSVSGSVLTLLAMSGMSVDEESSTPSRAPPDEVVEAVYKDLLQEKGSAIELHQAVEQCSAEVPRVIAWSLVKEISTAPPNEFLAAPAFFLSSVLLLSGHPSKAISSGNAKSLVAAASDSLPKDESQKRFGLLPKLPKTHKMQKMPKLKAKNKVDPLAIYPSFDLLREDPLENTYDHS